MKEIIDKLEGGKALTKDEVMFCVGKFFEKKITQEVLAKLMKKDIKNREPKVKRKRYNEAVKRCRDL